MWSLRGGLYDCPAEDEKKKRILIFPQVQIYSLTELYLYLLK